MRARAHGCPRACARERGRARPHNGGDGGVRMLMRAHVRGAQGLLVGLFCLLGLFCLFYWSVRGRAHVGGPDAQEPRR